MVFICSRILLVQFVFLYSLFSFTLTTCLPLIHPKCHEYESYALLQFKEGFHIDKFASVNPLGYPKTASWNSSTDCCSWDGIQCDDHTNQVIQIDLSSSQLYGTMDANSSLFRLVHLRKLDLSDNDFKNSQIPSRIGELSQLEYLKLLDTNFFGEIPPQISQLSKLLFLELGVPVIENSKGMIVSQLNLKVSTLRSLIQNSTKLETLGLGLVTMASTLPDSLTNLTSLKRLIFSKCELHGEFPLGVFHLPNLKVLDLGYNPNLNGRLPEFQSRSLTMLGLDGTSFNGTLPVSIGKLSSLNSLSIPHCNFFGYIPSSFSNLTQLMYIDLRNNKFKGDLSASIANITKLDHLGVGFNEFTVDTISWIGKLTSLVALDISSVNIGTDIPLSFANLTQLEVLNAQNCNLRGEIPSWIMNLTNLVSINVAYNFLHGNVELNKFLKLKRLVFLSLSFNKLLLYSGKSSSRITDSRIQVLSLDSCNLVEIPPFIRDLSDVEFLSLSENNIQSLPNWLWKKESLQDLAVSNNSLTGAISPSICNLKYLLGLDLSLNNFSGNVPSCLGNFSQSLEILKINGNKLSGLIPQTYMIGNALQQIDLSNNNLQGQLPRELINSRRLEYFDVSHNNINDSFPFWLGDLPELKVLALSNNQFHGDIRCPGNMTSSTFPKLHIIDLSHNKFSGSFPSEMIQSWNTMKTSNTSQLQYDQSSKVTSLYNQGNTVTRVTRHLSYSFMMSNKGLLMVYEKLQDFYSLIAIDISSNKISGEIPQVIGDLKGLIFFNLSNNDLIGNIPSSLGKLTNLEALDLSFNNLSGKIPQQLTQLTFLEFFNVSFNNLSGPIPQNEQFSTFQDNSFQGNQGLCGEQLLNKCIDHKGPSFSPPSASDDDHESESLFELYWTVILIGYVGGLVAGVALGSAFYPDVIGLLKRVF
ncbi:receptor-like protein 6 [Trifolium pratense]|uniref:receptor-like protein 6 n=1 Tax=Trifolium pratense TaxID=57577 RepID=UPI001E690AFC|nr:receptor-like protein 6 [Trifolium pratense]